VTGLDEIVWAVNPQYDSVTSLASYYSLFAQRFLNLAGIACRLQIADAIPEYPLESKLRHGIFLAFKEALNNVVRHSDATEVKVAIGVKAGQLTIRITDNGCGLEPVNHAPGKDGIAGMRERMSRLGGACHLTSQRGQGTEVELRLPVRGEQ
jgi:signal transduction histidine kinase